MHLCKAEVNDVTVSGGGECLRVRPADIWTTFTPENGVKQVQDIVLNCKICFF